MSCRLAPRLGGGEAWNFSKSKSPYRAGKLVFFIFLHISLRKFWVVLLPRGSLGIEGLEIFSKSLQRSMMSSKFFQVPIVVHRGSQNSSGPYRGLYCQGTRNSLMSLQRVKEELESLLSPYRGVQRSSKFFKVPMEAQVETLKNFPSMSLGGGGSRI